MTGADADTRRVAEHAHDEWDYRTVEGDFGQSFDTAIPAQLRFTKSPSQDTDRFHAALENRDVASLDTDPARRHTPGSDRPWYDGEVMIREGYKRLRVVVMRGDTVRIFPGEDIPDVEELDALVTALVEGFDAPLEHDPIDRDDDQEHAETENETNRTP